MFTHAITRKPGANFSRGITTAKNASHSYELIVSQHAAYLETLRSFGLEVIVLNSLPDYPDAYFVEDTAVVTPQVAVVTIPGATSRRGEADAIAPVLADYRKIKRIQPPGTVDGGDVLMVGNHFIIGISERTNTEGAEQLGKILQPFGNTWATVPVRSGLHLKSSINPVGDNTLLLSREYTGLEELKRFEKIIVDEDEKPACNTLWINDHLMVPRGFQATRKKLEASGYDIVELDVSEVNKMDGGLTCMSLRF
jgi:dimethylargininase